jgi:hypothetical protein
VTSCADRDDELDIRARRRQHVSQARDDGATWDQIGQALRVQRQVAWRKFARPTASHDVQGAAVRST